MILETFKTMEAQDDAGHTYLEAVFIQFDSETGELISSRVMDMDTFWKGVHGQGAQT